MLPKLEDSSRLVIKIGSLLLADATTNAMRRDWLASLAADIALLKQQGKEVMLVSSGAIALGAPQLGLDGENLSLADKQAAAAVGQIALAEAWQQVMRAQQLQVAQMLVTAEDTEDRRRYLNARATLDALLSRGIVPLINENDSVTTAEIRYGDNDRLAARVAAMASADTLVLLSDIDGLYSADPKRDPNAQFIEHIDDVDETIWQMGGESLDHRSSGGMKTKLIAADIAMTSGCHMVIAPGKPDYPLTQIMHGGKCSWFIAKESPMGARKHWIASSVAPRGTLTVDDGASQALHSGKSLLPSGVRQIDGNFRRGDTVSVCDTSGEIARGLIAYGAEDARRILGKQTSEIEAILGYKGRDALIHRDDLVLLS